MIVFFDDTKSLFFLLAEAVLGLSKSCFAQASKRFGLGGGMFTASP